MQAAGLRADPDTVTGGEGGPAVLPSAPKRIVVLDAGLAGYAYALEAPVVAVDTRFPDGRINRRTGFPPLWSKQAVAQKSVALPVHADRLDPEAIKAHAPDLIIAGGRNPGGALGRAAQQNLAAIAPTLIVPETLPGWREELAIIAEAVGRPEAVAALIAAYEVQAKEVAGKITLPEGEVALMQANAGGIGEGPYAIAAGGFIGRTLSGLGFAVVDATEKIKGAAPDALGRCKVALAEVPTVFSTPNLLVVSNGTINLGQICCNPPYRQLPAVDSRQRWELDEAVLRPDYLGTLRMYDMIETAFSGKS